MSAKAPPPGNPVDEVPTSTPSPPDAADPTLALPELPVAPSQGVAGNADPSGTGTNEMADATSGDSQLPPPDLPTLPEPQQAALPELPMPTALPLPGATPAMPEQPGMSFLPLPGATQLPEISVVEEKKDKTWQTTLKPQIIPPTTNFNYRRVQLPSTISREEYNADNQHLPRRETRDQYATLLFTNIARNDVEATRALLNAGTPINVANVFGETPLAFAKRAGAVEVAQLLKARGGH